ncbi:hypothetical protein [Nesterenkonia alba]|uniref:hypothetical protein n=1 Tax=Nesterenkonia alba TaxID=515814 RepID=UPI0003B3E016|nr:hypothetical protein [Nesterenkonia alba]
MSASAVSGAARVLRGGLTASAAVGSAALAHTAAGHHSPHGVVVLLALLVAVPISTALSSVRLSRRRLAAAVVASQALLHGLFALFPAATASSVQVSSPAAGHAHHESLSLVSAAGGPTGAAEHLAHSSDATMLAAHVLAAAVTYAVLRHGEVLLAALADALGVSPAVLEVPDKAPTPSPRLPQWPAVVPLRDELWLGRSPRTLRGPPVW